MEYSGSSKKHHPAIFKDLQELGVECVELDLSLSRAEQMKESLKDRLGIALILHTEGDPGPYELAFGNRNVAKAAFYNIIRNLDICEELFAILHIL